jgi:hypothetical protein
VTPHDLPESETIIRRFTENDGGRPPRSSPSPLMHSNLYGAVSLEGAFIGSYSCADRIQP